MNRMNGHRDYTSTDSSEKGEAMGQARDAKITVPSLSNPGSDR